MLRRFASIAVGFSLLVAPLVASALIPIPQLPPNPTVADLQYEIKLLTDILNQLLALRYPTASNVTLVAAPLSGPAPLAVNFSVQNSQVNSMMIDFGDGTHSDLSACAGAPCSAYWSSSHTYVSTGTYTAKLYGQPCITSSSNGSACPQTLLASTNVSVGAGTENCANYKKVQCGAGTHRVGGQVFGGCQTGGQCVSDNTVTPPALSCSVSYSPSTITRDQTLSINWSGNGTSRSYSLRNTATGQTFEFSDIRQNGFQADTGFRTLDLGTYVRTDTVTSSNGTTATCSATLHIVATSTGSTSRFIATPTSGPAPLSVTFSNMLSVGNQLSPIQIDFGDGQTATAGNCVAPTDACSSPGTNTHTYAVAGTYSAKITTTTVCGTTNSIPGRPIYCPGTTLGKVTITVGGTSGSCPVYSPPLCGETQHLVGGSLLSNGCYGAPQCVSAQPDRGVSPNTGTCTFSGNTTAVTSAFGCSNWCSTFYGIRLSDLGEGVLPLGGTCVYKDVDGNSQIVAVTSSQNTNFANALASFSAALKAFLGQ